MRVSLVLLALLLAADSARAQDRGYVEALGGATFMATTSSVFGAEAGIHSSFHAAESSSTRAIG